MKSFPDYKLYIFDLDNTLYSENDHLFGGYKAIAAKLGNKDIADFLVTTFLKEGRANLFEKLAKQFLLDKESITICLETLRSYQPEKKFSIYPHMLALLEKLKQQNKQLALLTNGTVQQQKNKVANIEPALSTYFPLIVFANEMQKKPSPESVNYILEKTETGKENCIMIGDDPNDELTAKNAEVDFIYAKDL